MDNQVNRLIRAVSFIFEKYLDRYLYQVSRTEYHDIFAGQQDFYLRGSPISSATLYFDPDRTFATALDASNVVLSRYLDAARVVDYGLSPGKRYMKIVYTGGLATSTANVTIQMNSGGTLTYTVGEYVKLSATNMGTVVSWDATNLILVVTPISTNPDCAQAGFSVGDSVVGASSNATWVVAADGFSTTSNLVQDYPDIALAADYQIVHELITKEHPGMERIEIGEYSGMVPMAPELLPKVRMLLAPHRRIAFE